MRIFNASGLDVFRAYCPYHPIGFSDPCGGQVFNTLVLPVVSSLGIFAFAIGWQVACL
jgi:hypothetical protein